jgi:hypothetical protein
MATRSRADGSEVTNDWKDIVELARRLNADVASGRPINGEAALTLARAVRSLTGPPSVNDALADP